MMTRVIVILAAAFLFTSCGKKAEAPSPAAPSVVQPTAEQNEATPAPASTELKATAVSTPPAVSSTTTNANVTVDLEDLHYAVTGWARAHGRSPTNFEEFASTCGFQMPPPPPGKKYVFGSKYHVLLVNK